MCDQTNMELQRWFLFICFLSWRTSGTNTLFLTPADNVQYHKKDSQCILESFSTFSYREISKNLIQRQEFMHAAVFSDPWTEFYYPPPQ